MITVISYLLGFILNVARVLIAMVCLDCYLDKKLSGKNMERKDYWILSIAVIMMI